MRCLRSTFATAARQASRGLVGRVAYPQLCFFTFLCSFAPLCTLPLLESAVQTKYTLSTDVLLSCAGLGYCLDPGFVSGLIEMDDVNSVVRAACFRAVALPCLARA